MVDLEVIRETEFSSLTFAEDNGESMSAEDLALIAKGYQLASSKGTWIALDLYKIKERSMLTLCLLSALTNVLIQF